MKHLDHVRQLHQPHRPADLAARPQSRVALAVPALEHLKQRVAHVLIETKSSRQLAGDDAVRSVHRVHRLTPREEELDRRTRAPRGRRARGQIPQHEARAVEPDQVRGVHVGAQCDVIAEPPGLLVGVDMAADPRQQRDVVDDHALGLIETAALAEPEGDHALPKHVLHRMAQPQIGAQRQRRDQLGQAHPRAPRLVGHGSQPLFPPSHIASLKRVRYRSPGAISPFS
jgi:hypothetical protein